MFLNKKIDQAWKDINKAIEFNDMDLKAYALRARINEFKGDFVQAVADYSTAIDLSPTEELKRQYEGLRSLIDAKQVKLNVRE